MATTNERLDVVEFLISSGVDLNASNMEKYTLWVLQLRDFCTEITTHNNLTSFHPTFHNKPQNTIASPLNSKSSKKLES